MDITVPFGAGILFFPITFFIQDVTTEVYGFSRARHMVWLAILMIIFYIFYTQIAIHLPSGTDSVYKNNESFAVVFSTIPRQLVALIVSLLTGMLINDFFISKSKIIFGGQYLWARILGSTMVGEAVLQVVGGIIGFSDTLDFYTQLLPNMILAYGYKMLWNAATVPVIYLVSSYLKRKEGIDTFDYNVNYTPFKLSVSS
jgi:queuosine precursor transporter